MFSLGNNFVLLLFGRLISSLGDNIFILLIPIIVLSEYKLDVQTLSLFVFATYLPAGLAFFLGPIIENARNKRGFIIILEVLQAVFCLLFILAFYFKLSIYVLLLLYLCFHVVNNFSRPLEFAIIPKIIDKSKINDAVRYTMTSRQVIDISSNFLGSVLLVSLSILNLLLFDLSTFFLSIILFSLIRIGINEPTKSTKSTKSDKSTNPDQPDETEPAHPSYIDDIRQGFRHFISKRDAFLIITIEGILNGLTTMALGILPAYLIVIGSDVRYLGVLIALQKLAELVGILATKYIKWDFGKFFILDYLISGACITLIVFLDDLILKSILFFISFVVIGASGGIYGQMIYERYDEDFLARINTIITSFLTILIPLATLLPLIHKDSSNLIAITGIITLFFGILLAILRKTKLLTDAPSA